MINILVVLLTALVNLGIRRAWYSKAFFEKRWLMAMDKKEEAETESEDYRGPRGSLGAAFLYSLVLVYIFGNILTLMGIRGLLAGAVIGFWLWLGFVLPTNAHSNLYEKRSRTLFLLSVFYFLVCLLVDGAILGLLLT